ncbi:helix-turn-helix domain-containing protein [Candidatus Uabimicrobium amorphum]|uniref:Transcriptional regulator n=1 Tax=Uabimicrobium amorphum TaxID=2596890 RepID=A0A5S9IQS1_UABAM|nr:helix-turn-helix transcriptional regulator [Candidatus Uabimicrobium amorphum]BBM85851.1 transcriptional regulator [Candidatus Uabimicrobium amorphum]
MVDKKAILGEKIRSLRVQQGMNQKQLADVFQRHQSFISEIEKGKRSVTYEDLITLSEYFNVNLEFFDYRNNTTSQNLHKKTNKEKSELALLKERVDNLEKRFDDFSSQ